MTVGTKTEENEELIKDNHDWEDEDSVVRNLTCILVTGIQDPVRDEVSDTLPTPKHTLSPPPPPFLHAPTPIPTHTSTPSGRILSYILVTSIQDPFIHEVSDPTLRAPTGIGGGMSKCHASKFVGVTNYFMFQGCC